MASGFATGWRQVGASLALLAACGMIASTYSIIAVPLAKEFQPSRMVLMLAMTIMAAISGVLSPVVGNLMDRTPLRRLMLFGAVMLSLGYAALSFATSFNQVLVIFGIFMAPANVMIGPMAATVLLSRWFVKRRGTAIGIAISGIALGGFVFPPIIQGLLDGFDWRTAFRLLGLVIAVLTVPAALLIVDRPSARGLHPDGAETAPEPGAPGTAGSDLSVRAILSDPAFWLGAIVFSVVLSGMKGMVTNLAPMAIDEGIDASVAALLISIYAASGFVAKMGFAAIADRLSPRTLMLISLAGFAAGAACLIRADLGYWLIATGVALIGLFGGLMVPMQSLLVPRIFGAKVVGRAAGLLSLVTLVALLSTPPLFGLIFDLTGDYDAIFIAFAGLAAVTMVIVPYIRLHPRSEGDSRAPVDGAVLAGR